jgi:hypothetical protein
MKCRRLFAVLSFVALLSAPLSRAQLLSVDINKSQAPRTDDTAPGFVGWYDVSPNPTLPVQFYRVKVGPPLP